MRVVVVVAAMLFCMTGCSQKEIQKSVVVEPRESVTNSIGMELIEIPAGKFTMGSPADEKDRFEEREAQVSVTLTKPFELGKTEVTQGQWKEVMGTEPWSGEDVELAKDCPATFVSWNDATKFCQKLTEIERKSGTLKADEEYRLPTEAQWEYACRAGTTTTYSFGDDEKQFGDYAWFRGNAMNAGEEYAHKVGWKKPNPWGLHDMHGNVWEWCSDWYDGKLAGGIDPVGPNAGSYYRVLRGGNWDLYASYCRSAIRDGSPTYRGTDVGFRIDRVLL